MCSPLDYTVMQCEQIYDMILSGPPCSSPLLNWSSHGATLWSKHNAFILFFCTAYLPHTNLLWISWDVCLTAHGFVILPPVHPGVYPLRFYLPLSPRTLFPPHGLHPAIPSPARGFVSGLCSVLMSTCFISFWYLESSYNRSSNIIKQKWIYEYYLLIDIYFYIIT